jgi:Xaa-Pro aminopeptidase
MSRVGNLLKAIKHRGLDALFLLKQETVSKENVRYISGFCGSSAHLIISKQRRILLTDERYTEQAASQCPEFEVIGHDRKPEEKMREVLAHLKSRKVGYETEGLTVEQLNSLRDNIPGIEWIPTKGIIEDLRAVKSSEEIQYLEQATQLATAGFNHVLNLIRPGAREQDLALELEIYMRKNGAEAPAFETVLISGARSSLQHGTPSQKKIEAGDFVVLDFGAQYLGYKCDLTRTVAVNPVSQKQREVYEIVKNAQSRGLELLKPGMCSGEIYAAVQQIITKAGYAEYSGWGIGHGVGLEIHEAPSIRANGTAVLEAGQVLTMEPGIYIPGWGGVRIEDTVVVEERGCRVLAEIPKHLIVL